ncbi:MULTISPECIES: 16S rRNA (guanine(966)-N(2))-methyltransferase RsmD [Ruminococcus]|jgi:16S rRNA (guanine(966)-N(2))-methyltransferase RsmD|uniref:16S rRNA (Guanine(966)-N(2))-methyltransferase RsmD n=1 Tax=Ruminococcus flavefaciens TaxID=1265 RepID=A0A315XVA3_RUMFL|nr:MULTISPECIES: 16S rRNA (guanine(966)-N(2))-methyltransferase RsmD [Ruminococcus]MBQ6252134.1 16S rRNA (guanine(966)-N(2))-methyltransferase RsmD [Ruminococcus sp.]MBR3667897.1 16S rRNA (guanine(966)-N(2))-methyltransferase RsmD [Ruminococcus sp.]MBR6996353.1 16S rRNA (guanine(966)-N(2))-methyltransferase RsmD [Ruminococcus sp.]PWJ10131.1 16S rRNA (guanine(966)-N(2))-methyltransferase RsmD [Ruminococcus flavefaciens]SSA52085.1 16S rRNA (guanine(966)-N(2))-methyltransferase RsmD [Ruminococcus
MRVITGIARGRKLVAPEGLDVRPTADKVKEGIFSAVQFELEGARVLDLFAGSGQMGIEALSRGAERAVFIDSSLRSIRCVNENLRNTGFERQSEVINRDSYDYIKLTSQTFDIIILDPPYRYNHIANILPFAAKKLRDGGIIICEYETEADEPAAPEGMRLRKTYRYGKINVSIFCKPSEEVADE